MVKAWRKPGIVVPGTDIREQRFIKWCSFNLLQGKL